MCHPSSSGSTLEHQNSSSYVPSPSATAIVAIVYVVSGVFQPLLMTLIDEAGLADPSAQIYMVFYYLGPATLTITLFFGKEKEWSARASLKAGAIAIFDIVAQALNYTGASLAGPTIFAIVYSSVAIWAALFSKIMLGRAMNFLQWVGVLLVLGGLALAGTESISLGTSVTKGTILVVVGSALHALTYVLSEHIMTKGRDCLTAIQTSAIQSYVALVCLTAWQVLYTLPRYDVLLLQKLKTSETTVGVALSLLGCFAFANLIHSNAFFFNLKFSPGGSTSTSVLKGLQAVIVFVFTSLFFCGRLGGEEMCFTSAKFISLLTVTGGVILYGISISAPNLHEKMTIRTKSGYTKIDSIQGFELENVA